MRNFSARETKWLLELDGIELAGFRRRALAFLIDWTLISVVLSTVLMSSILGYMKWREHHKEKVPETIHFDLRPGKFETQSSDEGLREHFNSEWVKVSIELGVPVLYFGLLTWRGKGRSPGKRIMKIRVISLVHRHLTLWHSVERALGYGAAALEGGFGFVQYFIHPYRRCVQDRIAETIVVTERGFRALEQKMAHEPTLSDEAAEALPEPQTSSSST